jgi:hypothetical protein
MQCYPILPCIGISKAKFVIYFYNNGKTSECTRPFDVGKGQRNVVTYLLRLFPADLALNFNEKIASAINEEQSDRPISTCTDSIALN